MDPAVAVTILIVVLVVLALAIFLIATIMELRKITNGLDIVIAGVGEIVAKTAPVNGVLDAVNSTLVVGRNVLEGLFLKKAGPYSAGLVESCFPGEGQKFLQRVGRSGTVMPIGEEFAPGAATLGTLVAATRGQAPPAPAPAAAPEPPAAPHPAAAPSGRIVLTSSAPSATAVTSSGRISLRGSAPGAPAAAPPPPPPPPPPAADDGGDEGAARLNVRGSRPWER